MSAYLISKPQGDFTPFRITAISGNTLTLDKPITHTPLAILPITHHTLSVYDNALWLDSVPLIYDVESFEIIPLSFSQGILLELHLCVKTLCQTAAGYGSKDLFSQGMFASGEPFHSGRGQLCVCEAGS